MTQPPWMHIHWTMVERPDSWDLPTGASASINLRWPWLARAVVRVLRWAAWNMR